MSIDPQAAEDAFMEFYGLLKASYRDADSVAGVLQKYALYDGLGVAHPPALREGYGLMEKLDALHFAVGIRDSDDIETARKEFHIFFSEDRRFSTVTQAIRDISLEAAAYARIYGDKPILPVTHQSTVH